MIAMVIDTHAIEELKRTALKKCRDWIDSGEKRIVTEKNCVTSALKQRHGL